MENFRIDHLDIQAATAGNIENARNWTFADIKIQTADRSSVQVKNSENVTGLPTPTIAGK